MKKILILAFLLRILLSFSVYHPDLGNHLDWGEKFWQLGVNNLYENTIWKVSWVNQPPGTVYIFALMRKIYEVIFSVVWWLNVTIPIFPSIIIPFMEQRLYVSLVKLPSILADLGIAIIIYKFIKEKMGEKKAKIASMIFLFNPVIWYNSAVWGQTDSLVNLFGVWSIYSFFKKRSLIATFLFFLSLYIKGSLVIFLPLILFLLFKSNEKIWKKIFVLIGSPVVLALISIPFVRWNNPIIWLYNLYLTRIFGHQGNMLTANAFNIWALFYGIDFSRNDLIIAFGLSLKKWGQILFSLFMLFPAVIFLLKKKIDEIILLSICILIAFASFCLLTNMHERYLFPVFPYLSILIFFRPRLTFFYIFLSLMFLLNMYNLWFVPDVYSLRLIFTPFIIKIFSLTMIAMFVFFYIDCLRLLNGKKV